MKALDRSRNAGEAGFSLFEIAVAMAILSLIAGTVLSMLWQAGDTASEIRNLDRRDEEINRFVALLRETIEGLPPEATMAMTPASETDSGYDELKLENASTAFVFGETVGSSAEVFIALRPGEELPNGGVSFDLAISRDDFVPDDEDGSGMVFNAGAEDFLEEDDEGRFWLPLLTGVAGASWRFWDEEQQEWIEEWTDEEKMPPLMEFALVDAGVTIPAIAVFEVPDRLVDPDAAEQAQSASTGSPVETGSSGRANGGDDSGRGGGRGSRGDGGGDRGGRGGDSGRDGSRGDGGRDGPRGDGGRAGGDGSRGGPGSGGRPGGGPPGGGPPGGGSSGGGRGGGGR